MSSVVTNYAKVLCELSVDKEAVCSAEKTLNDCPELLQILESPTVSLQKKYSVADKVFSDEIKNFIKVVCKNGRIDLLDKIFSEYKSISKKVENILTAVVYYVAEPTDEQQKGLKEFLKKKHNATEIELELVYKPELIGGFVIDIDGHEYDRSIKNKLDTLKRKYVRR